MRYLKQSRLAAPPGAVFAFHEGPDALERLTPPWSGAQVVQPPANLRVGTRVVLRMRFGPVGLNWTAVHTAYEPPHRFADRQESGPFARWEHEHRFLDDGQGGTILEDEIDFDPPLGALGRWLTGWFIRRKLDALFTYRHDQTRRAVEGAGPPTTAA